MKKNLIIVGTSLFIMFCATTTLAAPSALNHDEAVKLIKGNTAEGANAFKKKMIWYFNEEGVIYKGDEKGRKKGKGEWSIDSRGKLCYQDKHMHEENCGAILPLGDGKYEVRLENPWKWDKVVPGNPHNL